MRRGAPVPVVPVFRTPVILPKVAEGLIERFDPLPGGVAIRQRRRRPRDADVHRKSRARPDDAGNFPSAHHWRQRAMLTEGQLINGIEGHHVADIDTGATAIAGVARSPWYWDRSTVCLSGRSRRSPRSTTAERFRISCETE